MKGPYYSHHKAEGVESYRPLSVAVSHVLFTISKCVRNIVQFGCFVAMFYEMIYGLFLFILFGAILAEDS